MNSLLNRILMNDGRLDHTELMKNMLKMKLRMGDGLLSLLPEGAGSQVKRLQRGFLATLNEVLGDYLGEEGGKPAPGKIQKVDVE